MKRKFFAAAAMVAMLFAIGVMVGCNEKKKEETYRLVAEQTFYTVSLNESFTIPEISLLKGEEKVENWEASYLVKAPDGSESAAEGSFVLDQAGDWTLTVTVKGKLKAEPFVIRILCQDLRTQAAPQDVAVDWQTGKITFSEEEGATYLLYVNGTEKGAVKSGDKIAAQLSAGKNEIWIVADARTGYLLSGPSNTVQIEKLAKIEDLALQGGKIVFTEQAGETYILFNAGENLGKVQSGQDVSDQIAEGKTNIFTVVTSARDGKLESDPSNAALVTYHNRIEDMNISSKGILSFGARSGFSYALWTENGKEKSLIKESVQAKEDISSVLNALPGGRNELYIRVQAIGENTFVSAENEESVSCPIIKSEGTGAFEIDAEYCISFTEEEHFEYRLYIDGVSSGIVHDGEDISTRFTQIGQAEVNLSCGATEDGYWGYGEGEVKTLQVPKFTNLYFTASGGGADTLAAQSYEVHGCNIQGVALRGSRTDVFRFAEPIELDNPSDSALFTFQAVPVANAFQLNTLSIRLIDMNDAENYVTIRFWHGKDNHANTFAVAGVGTQLYGYHNGVLSDTIGNDLYWHGVSLDNYYPFIDATQTYSVSNISFRYDYAENAVYVVSGTEVKVLDLDDDLFEAGIVSSRWGGFSSSRVYAEIEFTEAKGVSEIIVSKLGEFDLSGKTVVQNFIPVEAEFENFASESIQSFTLGLQSQEILAPSGTQENIEITAEAEEVFEVWLIGENQFRFEWQGAVKGSKLVLPAGTVFRASTGALTLKNENSFYCDGTKWIRSENFESDALIFQMVHSGDSTFVTLKFSYLNGTKPISSDDVAAWPYVDFESKQAMASCQLPGMAEAAAIYVRFNFAGVSEGEQVTLQKGDRFAFGEFYYALRDDIVLNFRGGQWEYAVPSGQVSYAGWNREADNSLSVRVAVGAGAQEIPPEGGNWSYLSYFSFADQDMVEYVQIAQAHYEGEQNILRFYIRFKSTAQTDGAIFTLQANDVFRAYNFDYVLVDGASFRYSAASGNWEYIEETK